MGIVQIYTANIGDFICNMGDLKMFFFNMACMHYIKTLLQAIIGLTW